MASNRCRRGCRLTSLLCVFRNATDHRCLLGAEPRSFWTVPATDRHRITKHAGRREREGPVCQRTRWRRERHRACHGCGSCGLISVWGKTGPPFTLRHPSREVSSQFPAAPLRAEAPRAEHQCLTQLGGRLPSPPGPADDRATPQPAVLFAEDAPRHITLSPGTAQGHHRGAQNLLPLCTVSGEKPGL